MLFYKLFSAVVCPIISCAAMGYCSLGAELPFVFFLTQEKKKKALFESRQLFEAAAARTSGLVNFVFSCQTVFSSATIRLVIKPIVIIEPAVPKNQDGSERTQIRHIRPGFETVSWQHEAHAQ